jgi:hypothetical protein
VSIVDYCVMISLCFLFLPFTYFYAEEALSSDDEISDLLQDGFSDEDEEQLVPKGRFSFLRNNEEGDGAC